MIYQWTQVIDIKSEQKIVAHNKLKDSSMHSSVFDDFFCQAQEHAEGPGQSSGKKQNLNNGKEKSNSRKLILGNYQRLAWHSTLK